MTKRGADREERLSVALFPAWSFPVFVVLPVLYFVAHVWTAPDTYSRAIYWVGCLIALVLGVSVSFLRVVVRGPELTVHAIAFGRRSVRLDRLTSVEVKRKTGRKGRYVPGAWIIVCDHDGRRVGFSPDRARDEDRDCLLELIRRYADETSAVKIGPDGQIHGGTS